MKTFIKNNEKALLLGYAVGVTTMVIFDVIESIVLKIAILITTS